MLALPKNLSVSARSLMFLAIVSQAGLAFGGITPLYSNVYPMAVPRPAAPEAVTPVTSPTLLDQMNTGAVTVPVVDIPPTPSQAVTPASVPLPPAIETGLSGGAALMIAAGLRKLRRVIRRGF